MQVTILRGIPGSGKSHYGRMLASWNPKDSAIVSADLYFSRSGEYVFVPAEIGDAHRSCFRSFMNEIAIKTGHIIVDNTALGVVEIAPYYLAAESFGYDVEIVNVKCDAEKALARQTHGVPAEIHAIMAIQFDTTELPPWWNVSSIALQG